jgi:phospholipase/carboxylesterase
LRVSPVADLSGKSILLLSGAMDPIASADSTARLIAAFGKAGAQVEHRDQPAGHELSQADISAARSGLVGVGRAELRSEVA